MIVGFRCGHVMSLPREAAAAPVCAICGERVVSRVSGAEPKFVGACRGPYAETKAIEASAAPLVATPLRLKAQE